MTIDLPKGRRAKLIVMKEIQQSYIGEFKRLREYADELLSTNIGSTVKLEVDRSTPDEPAIFHRMYICFGAIKENFMHGCRPIIGLDGCFLKGLVKGQLLVAVGRDGNNQMFPIAWSIIQGRENTDNWKWFLNLLKADLGIIDGMGWTIMSDMQKGLLCSISDLLPFVEQRMCARHIYARWGKRFRGDELKFQFWICARSPNNPEFEKNMAALRQINEEAHDYLKEQWDPIHWCQAFFSDFSKCDVIDNNMCETLNGVILEARCKPIISMLEEIKVYIMRRLVKNREYGRNWKTDYAPRQLQKLEKN
nr:uncharacterized protein LOC109163968 [Ipomoea batatas]